MGRYVGLLRGINVGGSNRLLMKDLSAMFVDEGCEDVGTYIQSGNVVLSASAALYRSLPERIGVRLQAQLGAEVPLVMRSKNEFAAIADGHSFSGETNDDKLLHVGFLRDKPRAAAIAKIDGARAPTARFDVVGKEIFLYIPDGIGKTKLTTAHLESALGTKVTIRNQRTVKKLRELLDA